MNAIDPAATLGDLVSKRPEAAALFERLGIDYCCGGAGSLEHACAQRGLDAPTVAVMLESLDDETASAGPDPHDLRGASIAELCDHVVAAHHDPLRTELVRISELLETVARVHGETHRELYDLKRLFAAQRADLEHHMDLEEEALFPACRELEPRDPGSTPFGADLLELLEDQHSSTGDGLSALRELCGGYRSEAALCSTHRSLLRALHAFELDLHLHVHEENNVLFPQVRDRLAAGV